METMPPQTPSSSGSDSSLKGPCSSKSTDGERLLVAVRIRPLKSDEGPRVLHAVNEKTCVIEEGSDKNDVLRQKRGKDKKYCFDHVFGEYSTQEEVYNITAKPLVKDIMDGINATVFAYGATGAGKTHTMVGDSAQPGIMVRALDELFQAVRQSEKSSNYSVTMSYMELYNEQIRDLLNPTSGYLELREDSKGRSISVAGLSEISTTSTNEVMQLLQKGNKARTVEPTAMNKTSSRSHALLSVTVKFSVPLDTMTNLRMRVRQARLFMIDLAGSERANKTKNKGKRLQEGAHINRSLLALGNCINALSGGARYVNYRDSKLTRLLKEALSGNCRTVMIAHVSPALSQKEESRNTLTYADRANHISNKVERNVLDVGYHVSQYQAVIGELREEIERLRTKMTEERPRSAELRKLSSAERANEVRQLREKIVGTFKEQMKIRRKLMEVDSHLLGLSMEAERQHLVIAHWDARNSRLYKNNDNSRARTQQSLRRREAMSSAASSVRSGHEIIEEEDDDLVSEWGDLVEEGMGSGEASAQRAWAELADIEREQERWTELRHHLEEKLETVRRKGMELEDELPALVSSEDEREILALMCRVHELEADKMALQSERLVRQHELRRRDFVILRYDKQRQLAEDIITKQRQVMEEYKIKLPPDLQDLYQLYQQEIHASTYNDISSEKLPPIKGDSGYYRRLLTAEASSPYGDESGRLGSAEFDLEQPLPQVLSMESTVDRVMGHQITRPGQTLRFPPLIQRDNKGSRGLINHATTSSMAMRKASGENIISSING